MLMRESADVRELKFASRRVPAPGRYGKSMNIFSKSMLLLMLVALNAFGQKAFLVTNNDSFRRPNSVSTYAIQADGSLLRVGQFATGGKRAEATAAIPAGRESALSPQPGS
jgi:hypothetical protein